MKKLFIRWDDKVLFDGPVASIQWSESDGAVEVKASTGRKSAPAGAAILDALAAASKAKAQQPPRQNGASDG